ncbi:MAG: glycosyltransferase family 4 protein [Planctomycetota bacterium]
MNIIHVHDKQLIGDGPGVVRPDQGAEASGIAVYLSHVINAQTKRGDLVRTVRFRPGIDALDAGSDHATYPSSATRRRAKLNSRVLQWLSRASPDVVHLHSVYYALHPTLLSEIAARFPTVCTIHDVTPICFRRDRLFRGMAPCSRSIGVGCVTSGCFLPSADTPVLEWGKRLVHHRGSHPAHEGLPLVVTPSEALASMLRGSGFVHHRLRVIPLFTRFEAEASAQHPPPGRTPAHIVCLGRVAREKGQHLFIEALERLPASMPWTATLAGDGPDLARVRDTLARSPINARVTLAGRIEASAAARLYARADLVVMPSCIPESFGLVGVEAMSFARPVVAFPSGGVTEWLDDTRTGLLASHGSAADLGSKIAAMIDDPARRVRLGLAGQQHVRERFTLAAHLESLDAVYSEATPCQATARVS